MSAMLNNGPLINSGQNADDNEITFGGLIGLLIAKISPADDRRFLALVETLNLPMSFAAFYLVRLPMDSALKAMLGAGATTAAV